MTEQPAEAAEQQPEGPAQPRGADPNRVIDRLTQQCAGLTQQLAIAQVIVEERNEEIAELRRVVDQLRGELVAATSARPPAVAKPATRRDGSGRP